MTTPAETQLMQSIRGKYHAEIEQAVAGSLVPPEFLAALVANESGGNADAKRFEKNVLASLWEVVQGRASHYGSLGRADVFDFIRPAPADLELPADLRVFVSAHITDALQRLDSLATSWGLTQIMGYEAIAFDIDVATLQAPASGLQITRRMVTTMANGKRLDLAKDFSGMFDCWNTGRPHAPTADPQYIPNGLARMQLYRDIAEEPIKVVSA